MATPRQYQDFRLRGMALKKTARLPSFSRVISGAQKSVSAHRGRRGNTEPAMRQLRMSGERSTRKTGADPPLVATATVSLPSRIADGSGQSPATIGAGRASARATAGRESTRPTVPVLFIGA